MRAGARMVVATGLIAATMAASPSPRRLVFVVAQPGDPRAVRQHADLAREGAALRARDVQVVAMTPDAARRLRPEWGVDAEADFAVLLVGKDGTVKLRRQAPVPAAEIAALIDTMPMRRQEMRR